MRIGSLFAGIGGLELGLERAGVGHTAWQVEIDPYCQAVLAKHWPDAKRYADVREVGAHNLEPVEVICGGFPCQDISYAGRGAGIKEGTRSGLWYEFARVVREMEPRYVVVENVRALLTRGIDTVLGSLADLGYDAEWGVLSAAGVGAPHLRKRVFLVAYPGGTRRQQESRGPSGNEAADAWGTAQDHYQPERDGEGGGQEDVAYSTVMLGNGGHDHPGGHREGPRPLSESRNGHRPSHVADAHRCRHAGPGTHGDASHPTPHEEGKTDQSWHGGERPIWSLEPDVGRVAHGVPARVDRLRALGNAVVPQVAEVVGRRLLEIDAMLRREAA